MSHNQIFLIKRLNDFIKLSNSIISFTELSDLLNLWINNFFECTSIFVCAYYSRDNGIDFIHKKESFEFSSKYIVELFNNIIPNINEPLMSSSVDFSNSDTKSANSICYLPILIGSQLVGFLVAIKKDDIFSESEIAINNCFVSILENIFDRLLLMKSRSPISKELGDRCVEKEELIKTADQSLSDAIESARLLQIKELENKAIINSIIDNSDYYIWAVDKNFKLLFINNSYKRAVFRAIGKEVSEGESLLDYMNKEEFAKYSDFMTKTMSGAKSNFENIREINGIRKTYQISFYPIYLDKSGEIIGLVAFMRDISDEKQFFDEISNELKKERGLKKYLNRFIALISHEYKTPLTTIATSSYILERILGENIDPKLGRQINAINKSIDKINNLLNQTLTLSKIETNKLCFVHKATFVKEHCEGILYGFSNDERQRIVFEYRGDNEQIFYPSIAITIIADNLLSNALKFSHFKKEILFTVEKSKSVITINVKDFGDGIQSENLPFIFEPFYRGESSVGVEGFGLGLSIARDVAESFGGTITAESLAGYGSEFIVNLPIADKR